MVLHEEREFDSWQRALTTDRLTPEQLAMLQTMVDEGRADNLERAAQLLDWQGSVIDLTETMHGP